MNNSLTETVKNDFSLIEQDWSNISYFSKSLQQNYSSTSKIYEEIISEIDKDSVV